MSLEKETFLEEYIERLLYKNEKRFIEDFEYVFFVKVDFSNLYYDTNNELKKIFGKKLGSLAFETFFDPGIDDVDIFYAYIYINCIEKNEYVLSIDLYTDGELFEKYFIKKIDSSLELIKIIKKVGKYYNWRDDEEIFIENKEKKEKTLFSLFFFYLN